MSTYSLNFFARTLNFRTEVKVALPEYPLQRDAATPRKMAYPVGTRFPVVYLLHGYTGDYSDWFQMVPIERYAQEYGFAIVMPHGYNCWYMDVPNGPRVQSFIAEELPAAMEAMLPISDDPRTRFIAGLSMGGTGAVQTMLRHPMNYRATASASGVMDRGQLRALYQSGSQDDLEMLSSLARAYPEGCPDISELYLRLQAEGRDIPPHLFLYGTQDAMFDTQYDRFVQFASEHALPVTADCFAGGHDFAFWDPAIRRILQWFRQQLDER